MKTLISSVDARENFPLYAYGDDALVSRHADLTIGFEIELPELFSSSEQSYCETLASLQAALRLLPAWTVVHRQDRFEKAAACAASGGGTLTRSYHEHFAGRQSLMCRSFLFITFSRKAVVMQNGSESLFFKRGTECSLPGPEALESMEQKALEFMSVFSRGRIPYRRLRDEDYFSKDSTGLIDSYFFPGEGSASIQHDIVFGEDGSISIGDRSLELFVLCEGDALPESTRESVEQLGGETSKESLHVSSGSVLGPLLLCEHTLNQYWVTAPQQAVRSSLQRKANRMFSMSLRDSENRVNAEAIEQYNTLSAEGSVLSVYSHINLQIYPLSGQRGEQRALVSSALSSLGLRATRSRYDSELLFWAGCPGAGAELGCDNLMLQECLSVSALTNLDSYQRGFPAGSFHLCDRLRHIPLRLDLQRAAYDQKLINNYNAFVVGGAGSGKSFFVNHLLAQSYEAGEEIFVIDVGHSYRGLCALVRETSSGKDGHYLCWDSNHPLSFSLFEDLEQWRGPEHTLRTDHPGYQMIVSLLTTLWTPSEGWSQQHMRVLTRIIELFIDSVEKGRTPVFDDLYRFLETKVRDSICFVSRYEAELSALQRQFESAGLSSEEHLRERSRLNEALTEDYQQNAFFCSGIRITPEIFDIHAFCLSLQNYITGGSYGFLLNNTQSEDIHSGRFTVCEVGALASDDSTFYSICILCIVNAFNRRMKDGSGRFRRMVIDEAWLAIANKTMAPYLASLWRTSRKHSVSAMVITQGASDITSSEIIRKAIIDNSSLKVVLSQGDNLGGFPQTAEFLGLSSLERAQVLSIGHSPGAERYGKEVFIKWGDRLSGVFSVEVPRSHALIYESDLEKKKPLFALAQTLLSEGVPQPLWSAAERLSAKYTGTGGPSL